MINYMIGDATRPIGDSTKCFKFIIHCVNDCGKWGKGFVLPLGARYPYARQRYIDQWRKFKLGENQFVLVDYRVAVINMFGQHGIYPSDGVSPIRYDAIRSCLANVYKSTMSITAVPTTVHCPRFGAGLAGGDWRVIEAIINEELVSKGIEVYVYDLRK